MGAGTLTTTDPVVTVTGQPADGQVVRWFRSPADATRPGSAPLTATARGVAAAGYLTDVPAGWVDAARRVYEQLRANPYTDLSRLATHYYEPPGNGPLRPVQAGGKAAT